MLFLYGLEYDKKIKIIKKKIEAKIRELRPNARPYESLRNVRLKLI